MFTEMIQKAITLYLTKSSIQKNTFIKCMALKNNFVPIFSLCKTSALVTFHYNYCRNYAGLKKQAHPRSCKLFFIFYFLVFSFFVLVGVGGALLRTIVPEAASLLGGIALKR